MGVFTVPIQIAAGDGRELGEFDAIVDTGASFTSLPASALNELGVARTRRETFRLANGETGELDMGEARVRINGVETTTLVLFAEEESPILLGAYTLEGLLLGVDPHGGQLVQITGYR